MNSEDPLRQAARELAASWGPPTVEEAQALALVLRQIAARRAAVDPETLARREDEREMQRDMRRACERYLAGEIRLAALTRRLRWLEQEQRATRHKTRS
jgi:hypothetical protein